MKCQFLFLKENKGKKSTCRLLKYLPSMLSIKSNPKWYYHNPYVIVYTGTEDGLVSA